MITTKARQAMLLCHPDKQRNTTDKEITETKFKEYNNANKILTDENKKLRNDVVHLF